MEGDGFASGSKGLLSLEKRGEGKRCNFREQIV